MQPTGVPSAMKRLVLLSSALAVATTLLISGGPAAESAQAGKCSGGVTIKHPNDPSWATYCPPRKIAICDNQGDKHDTWVRVWKHGVGGNRLPARGNDTMGPRWNPGAALITPRDTLVAGTATGAGSRSTARMRTTWDSGRSRSRYAC